MAFSGSHCHLDRAQPELLPEILEQAKAKGVDINEEVATAKAAAVMEQLTLEHQCL